MHGDCHSGNAHHESHGDDHDKHAGHSPDMFRRKFWISLILTLPVLAYSPALQDWFGFAMPTFPGSSWTSAVFSVLIFFYGGSVFIKGAVAEIKDRLPGMMTLISLAIAVAFIYSLATMFFIDGMEFFWELATLITIMLFGHWMEMRSIMNAQGALNELAKLLPDQAELVDGQEVRTVPLDQLEEGDVVLIRPGSSVPMDGRIVSGTSSVNESMITGESRAVKKSQGDEVIGGTINGDGSLRAEITKTGQDTMLAGIMKLVEEAQASKSRSQILADKAAYYLTFIALSVAVLTFVGWLVFSGQGADFALERTVTVLIIACPHALGLAIPLVTSISTTLAARNGLLVRERLSLENARNIDVVLFDKTGTLTTGEIGVTDVWAIKGGKDDVLRLAASAEADSQHPLAKAIVRQASDEGLVIPGASDFRSLPGRGIEAQVEGETVSIGGPQLLNEQGVEVPESHLEQVRRAGQDGKTIIYVLRGQTVIGIITLADTIRKESFEAVEQLKKRGLEVAMLTGDSGEVAEWVANELGLNRHFAEVLPDRKVEVVQELQQSGRRVAMVGDGVNDAPALTTADIGIAIGAGTDVAIESAGIILASNDPRGVVKIFKLSRASYRKMQQNIAWATGYNLLAIPAAAGVFAGLGIILAPAVGAVLMSASTIIVAINAQFLRRVDLA